MDTAANPKNEQDGAGLEVKPAPLASAGKEPGGADQRQASNGRERKRPRVLRDTIIVIASAAIITAGWLWIREAPLRRAQAALEIGDGAKALSWSEFFLSYHPGDSRAESIKAQALVALGRPDEAIKLFDKVGVRSVDDTYIFARAYMMQEHWSRALPLLLRVLQMKPDHADALYEVTTCRLRLNYLGEALETAKRYAKLPGYEARGQLLLGIIHGDQGNLNASLRAYERAIELSPDGSQWQLSNEEVYSQYASVLLRLGRASDAVKVLQQSLERGETPAICAALGDAHMQSGNMDEAEKMWLKALELEPANIFAREGLANIALQRNEPEKALEYLEPLRTAANLKASSAYLFQSAYSRVNPEMAERWKTVTATLRKLGQRESQYDRALLTAPHSPAAMVIRAHRFASRGNYEQAQDIADDVAKALPNDEFVQELAEAIRNRTELPPLENLPINVPVDPNSTGPDGAAPNGDSNAAEGDEPQSQPTS